MKRTVIKNSFLATSLVVFVFGFSYWYPRFLASLLGEKSPWISYLYTYGIGSVFFFLSLAWIFTRRGVHSLRRKEELYWLIAIMASFLFLFSFHGLWIFLATNFPIKN